MNCSFLLKYLDAGENVLKKIRVTVNKVQSYCISLDRLFSIFSHHFMANTYTQITIQAVFAVKHREHLIRKEWRDYLHRYISGNITSKGATSLAAGGWLDHVHIFFGMPVTMSMADFIGAVKANSSKWVNEQGFLRSKFQWQEGYGAFSYAKSQRDIVIRYIMNQEAHHRVKTFRKEYIQMLDDFDVAYQDQYLFDFFK